MAPHPHVKRYRVSCAEARLWKAPRRAVQCQCWERGRKGQTVTGSEYLIPHWVAMILWKDNFFLGSVLSTAQPFCKLTRYTEQSITFIYQSVTICVPAAAPGCGPGTGLMYERYPGHQVLLWSVLPALYPAAAAGGGGRRDPAGGRVARVRHAQLRRAVPAGTGAAGPAGHHLQQLHFPVRPLQPGQQNTSQLCSNI